MSASAYTVLYDFEKVEENELSVHHGEVRVALNLECRTLNLALVVCMRALCCTTVFDGSLDDLYTRCAISCIGGSQPQRTRG